MAPTSLSSCCLKGFAWEGTPAGEEAQLAGVPAYITGPKDSDATILIIHDAFGWKFPNIRLLADFYAKNVDAQVFVPDFFGGETLDWKKLFAGDFASLDMAGFMSRNSKDNRRKEIFACASELRKQQPQRRIGTIGFCYGGWAVMELGAAEHNKEGSALVDCISTAHPSLATKEDMDKLGVPTQIQAPEHDGMFTPELKEHANRVIPTLNIPYEYVYLPGVEHGFATRGDSLDAKSKLAMRRSMESAVAWFRFWLKPEPSEK